MRLFAELEQLTIVVGEASKGTRTKVLELGHDKDLEKAARGHEKNLWFSNYWGRGGTEVQEERVSKLLDLMEAIKAAVDKTEEKRMPVVRVMVLDPKGLKDNFKKASSQKVYREDSEDEDEDE